MTQHLKILPSLAVGLLAMAPALLAGDAMPAPQQNALVQKYCAVCHDDAHANGGRVFEKLRGIQAARARVAPLLLLVVQRLGLCAQAFEQPNRTTGAGATHRSSRPSGWSTVLKSRATT